MCLRMSWKGANQRKPHQGRFKMLGHSSTNDGELSQLVEKQIQIETGPARSQSRTVSATVVQGQKASKCDQIRQFAKTPNRDKILQSKDRSAQSGRTTGRQMVATTVKPLRGSAARDLTRTRVVTILRRRRLLRESGSCRNGVSCDRFLVFHTHAALRTLIIPCRSFRVQSLPIPPLHVQRTRR